MLYDNKIWVGGTAPKCLLNPSMANRHGLIAGASGTGKSVTVKVLAEGFSGMGIPVFLPDIKGDMSGICAAGVSNDHMEDRIAKFEIDNFEYKAYPTTFYDCFGFSGIPMRTTISEMGPSLLGYMLGLSEKQCKTLSIVFSIADFQGLLLLDLKDLRMILIYIGDHIDLYRSYGISYDDISPLLGSVILLQDKGAGALFGEPAFDISDFFKVDSNGNGIINILSAQDLFNDSILYSSFLLLLLDELCYTLPNVDSIDKPKIVFFFDEAQILFRGTTAFSIEKLNTLLRMLQWKGVGVFFVTSEPTTIPIDFLSQLQNRIQHAQYAFSASERSKLKNLMNVFPSNSSFDRRTVLDELADGEAVMSFVEKNGVQGVAERSFIVPPQSFIGAVGYEKILEMTDSNPLVEKYGFPVDPESAFEILLQKYGANGG